MPAFSTLLYASLVVLAMADSSSSTINTQVVPLSSLHFALKIGSPIKTFKGPSLNTSAITHSTHRKLKGNSLSNRQTLVTETCLDPLDGIISQDCEALCDNLNGQQGPLVIAPLDIWYIEQGHCVFGVGNIDPCETIDLDPIGILYSFCQSMYLNCAINGYDGFLQYTDPAIAFALSGTPAAPPYTEGPCVS